MLNKTLSTAIVTLSFALAPLISFANTWTLDTAESSISFVSTKKDTVAEAHVFNDFSGSIESNTATVTILPDSVEIIMDVTILKTTDSSITITSQKPVIIKAEDYNLNEGIIKLSSLVGDIPITKAVPTYFSLVFKNS